MSGLVRLSDLAASAGLLWSRPNRRGQAKADHCPFCGDRKGNLELNLHKDVFHCWVCDSKGGVISFYAKLHGLSDMEAKQTLYPRHRTRPLHPAEHLTNAQLQSIGFLPMRIQKPTSWSMSAWLAYRKRTLDCVWQAWCEHEQDERETTERLQRLFEQASQRLPEWRYEHDQRVQRAQAPTENGENLPRTQTGASER
ncbi:CHC2 zinc finger domain-containing protein [Alicyclobacillus sp. SP_1]|uniref:CHC2 zinc finger domain-containing protein n=1 Tax=Alicyclobacillus sp. SP_1 TaxID=2942475 RepID=UPI002157AF4B|nr:CHC2 zinc finger domain-containing protein [Alicyclobacillus sp. SP_1]